MKTTVVNLKTDPYDIYIGRPGTFGNPFHVGKDGTRQQVIDKFRRWLAGDKAFENVYPTQRLKILDNLQSLKGRRLGCFCKPQSCHGDVYIELLEDK